METQKTPKIQDQFKAKVSSGELIMEVSQVTEWRNKGKHRRPLWPCRAEPFTTDEDHQEGWITTACEVALAIRG